MLYIGHFSFDEIGFDQEARHGYFSCIVDAQKPETALDSFKDHVKHLKNSEPIFGDIVAVYIEDIIEIKDIPKDVILTRFQSSEGQFPKSISSSLPSSDTSKIETYRWVDDGMDARGDEEYQEAKPFVRFDK